MCEPPQKCLPRTTVVPAPRVRPGSLSECEIIGITFHTSMSLVTTTSWQGPSFTSTGGRGARSASTTLCLSVRGSSASRSFAMRSALAKMLLQMRAFG